MVGVLPLRKNGRDLTTKMKINRKKSRRLEVIGALPLRKNGRDLTAKMKIIRKRILPVQRGRSPASEREWARSHHKNVNLSAKTSPVQSDRNPVAEKRVGEIS